MCSSPAQPPVWPRRRAVPVSPCNTGPRRLRPWSTSERAGPQAAGHATCPAAKDEAGRAGAPRRRAARHAAAAARCRACAAARRPPARAGAHRWPPRGCAAARTRAPARACGCGSRPTLTLSCGRPGEGAWRPRERPGRTPAQARAGAGLCLQTARCQHALTGWQLAAQCVRSSLSSEPPRPGHRPRPPGWG